MTHAAGQNWMAKGPLFVVSLAYIILAWNVSAPDAHALEVAMKTESWANNEAAFAKFDGRIADLNARNLLARDKVKIVDTGKLHYGALRMLTDGCAGVRLGDGRVGINGQPAVLTFYLGEPKVIKDVGLFTFNSDARANQDFEVRFANNAQHPGKKPKFRDKPDLTTGPKVLGNNTGGFHTYFVAEDGGELVPGRADWVQFRIWRTYNVKPGSPAKDKNTAAGWTSVIELEVLGDEKDAVVTPRYSIVQQEAVARAVLHKAYTKRATWQETMLASREALMQQSVLRAHTPGFRPYQSPLVRGGHAAAAVKVNVAGVQHLWLSATVGDDDYNADQAIWAEPKLTDKQGRATDLTTLRPAYAKVGTLKLFANRNHLGKPLQVSTREFKRGLWAHAPSRLCYVLNGQYEWFEAWVGIDVTAGRGGSVRFLVTDLPQVQPKTDSLWNRLQRDFSQADARTQMRWEKEDRVWAQNWRPGDVKALAQRYARATHRNRALAESAAKLASAVTDAAGLQRVRELHHQSRRVDELLADVALTPTHPTRLAIQDLANSYGPEYPKSRLYLERLAAVEAQLASAVAQASLGSPNAIALLEQVLAQLDALRHEALLANPLLDFDRLLVVKRRGAGGLPANWQGNCSLSKTGYDNEIAVLSPVTPEGKLTTLYRPEHGEFVGDVDLHFDADRLLFSSIGSHGRWQVFDIRADGTGLRQVTRGQEPDVDSYDACYLPDGDIIFGSTASFTGVPCVYGSSHVAMLYRMKSDGSGVRQLCFEQDHDWHPAMLNNGRVLYTRWEYTDTPHSQTRLLMHMNPDGTGQMEYYGSNSQWPNSIFYARPIPGHPTKVVGVISGHHGVRRMGELIIFDPAKGRHEASGVVQRIPGHGKKVEPIIRDALVNASWPRFLHPYPLSEKYFLVSCQPTPKSNWGIYLVDVFDNILLVRQEPGYVLFEPIPLRKTKTPPVIPDKVRLGRQDATLYMADVYAGNGLKGIPRDTVKQLRVFTYHFAYQGMGGLLGVVGMDGPWDIKRVLGTVPVQEDGSAMFRVPANTPISVQPLDSEGKALQLMRSWMTAMPGEVLSCVGCHEPQNSTVFPRHTLASRQAPFEIKPWRGPTRGFSYPREVQPVIDRHCVGCHNGQPRSDGKALPDLRGTVQITGFRMTTPGNGGGRGGKFSVGYAQLHRYVRRPGIESDYHLLTPMEFHADTTELVQMLQKGHHNVKLDPEAWDRLITWIDLNAPYHGTWHENIQDPGPQRQRRRELRKRYAGMDEDPEAIPTTKGYPAQFVKPEPMPEPHAQTAKCPSWPFDSKEAKKRQAAAAPATTKTVDLGAGGKIEFVLIPAGEFVMGGPDGCVDERPLTRVKIDKPFWLGKCEVTNAQYAVFDAAHDSHVEIKNAYQFGVHGYPLDGPQQPVVRASWRRAVEFCAWLSRRAGERFALPTEAQWEYACRAGAAMQFSYGGQDADFSKFANVADAKLSEFASNPYTVDQPLPSPTPYDDWIPKDSRFNDAGLVTVDVGKYEPNAWGLHDMHGNVWEWTRTTYRPYPYRLDDGRDNVSPDGRKVARGGSWRDRPMRCRAGFRLSYRSWQRVHNLGFRVMCEWSPKGTKLAGAR